MLLLLLHSACTSAARTVESVKQPVTLRGPSAPPCASLRRPSMPSTSRTSLHPPRARRQRQSHQRTVVLVPLPLQLAALLGGYVVADVGVRVTANVPPGNAAPWRPAPPPRRRVACAAAWQGASRPLRCPVSVLSPSSPSSSCSTSRWELRPPPRPPPSPPRKAPPSTLWPASASNATLWNVSCTPRVTLQAGTHPGSLGASLLAPARRRAASAAAPARQSWRADARRGGAGGRGRDGGRAPRRERRRRSAAPPPAGDSQSHPPRASWRGPSRTLHACTRCALASRFQPTRLPAQQAHRRKPRPPSSSSPSARATRRRSLPPAVASSLSSSSSA
eukprot:scaffold1556_cov278-Prasinococcus_capsulatus_cf.AAC.9